MCPLTPSTLFPDEGVTLRYLDVDDTPWSPFDYIKVCRTAPEGFHIKASGVGVDEFIKITSEFPHIVIEPK